MKKRLTKGLGIVICSIIFCCLMACGKSSSPIVGTWQHTELEETKLIFNSDGTWQLVDDYDPAHGTWQITEGKDNEIQMPSESGLGQDMAHVGGVHEFSIDGDILTIDGVGVFEKE